MHRLYNHESSGNEKMITMFQIVDILAINRESTY